MDKLLTLLFHDPVSSRLLMQVEPIARGVSPARTSNRGHKKTRQGRVELLNMVQAVHAVLPGAQPRGRAIKLAARNA